LAWWYRSIGGTAPGLGLEIGSPLGPGVVLRKVRVAPPGAQCAELSAA